MDRLIELLNEYDEGGNWRKLHWKGLGCENHDTIGYKDKELTCEQDEIVAYLISKKFGFIKWLIDNDKIDESKLIQGRLKYILVYERQHGTPTNKGMQYLQLLMLLAVSDTPIDDLISYLK